jgi:hypothetical protein
MLNSVFYKTSDWPDSRNLVKIDISNPGKYGKYRLFNAPG